MFCAVSEPSGYSGPPVPRSEPSDHGRHVNAVRQPRLMPIASYVDTVLDVGFQVVKEK